MIIKKISKSLLFLVIMLSGVVAAFFSRLLFRDSDLNLSNMGIPEAKADTSVPPPASDGPINICDGGGSGDGGDGSGDGDY